jgi:hypothetical protein
MLLFVAHGPWATVLGTAGPYLERGLEDGIAERYRCRTRKHRWPVPLPRAGRPDLLLTYCSNTFPRLVVNEARVLHTNTVHGVAVSTSGVSPAQLAASFDNSLTLLSNRARGGAVTAGAS